MFGLFYIAFVLALVFVTDIGAADSFSGPSDWKRELDVPREINVYISGNAHPTAADSQKVTPQKRDSTGITIVNGKLSVQLIFRLDRLERQMSRPDTIDSEGFGRESCQNTEHCGGAQCNYSSEFEIVDPNAAPAFTELKKININQRRRTTDGTDQNHKRVTALPRHLKPSAHQGLSSTSASRTAVRHPTPIPTGTHLVDRAQTTNVERARRTQTRTLNARTTTARYPVSFDSNGGGEGFLLEQRYRRTTEKSRTEVSGRKTQTWTVSDTEILFQEKTNETDSYGNRKRQIKGKGSAATFSDTDGDGVQSPEFNQSILRTTGKFLTAFPVDGPRQKIGITTVGGRSGGPGVTLNRGQHDSSTPVSSQMQVDQTTNDGPPSESPSPPVHCDELDCLPWERRDDFEAQVNPRTKEIVNVRVHTIAANRKSVIEPSEEHKDSRSTVAPPLPAPPPSSVSGNDEEFLWRHGDDHGVQTNPKTEQVFNIRTQPNTTSRSTVRPDERREDDGAEKSATAASGAAMEWTINNTRHEEITWFDRQDHQVQIDTKTGEVMNIRAQTKIKPTLRTHEHHIDSITEASARQAVSTPRVATQAPLPVPFSYRKQISSQSGDSDFILSNFTRDDIQTEIVAVIRGRNVAITDSPSILEPFEEPIELPWQLTKKTVSNRTRTLASGRIIPIPMLAEQQPTFPDNVGRTTTLNSETSWDSRESQSILEDNQEVQMNVQTTTMRAVPSNSKGNLPRKDVVRITTPISRDNGGQITTTPLLAAGRSTESINFPWEQRDDYEVQIDPETKQIVNIRLQTIPTHDPISKSADASTTVRSQTGDRAWTLDISEIVEANDERDDVFVQHSGSNSDQNGKMRTQVVSRQKVVEEKLVEHTVPTDDEMPHGQRSRVVSAQNQKDAAIRPPINGRERTTQTRRPIFSHSDADGVLYFRFADNDELWEELELQRFNGDAKFFLVDEDDWISARRGRGGDSPYFYFSRGNRSSALISFSGYTALLVACLVSFIS